MQSIIVYNAGGEIAPPERGTLGHIDTSQTQTQTERCTPVKSRLDYEVLRGVGESAEPVEHRTARGLCSAFTRT